jgi:hypothetical protein
MEKPQPPAAVGNPSSTPTSITFRFTVNSGGASDAATRCKVTVNGGATKEDACSGVTVGGLYASSTYTYTVTASNPAGTSTPSNGSASTTTVSGTALCVPPSNDPEQQEWCNGNPGNALEVQTDPSGLHNGQVGKTKSGNPYVAYCYVHGVSVKAWKYNNEKETNIWVSIRWNNSPAKQYYTPLAWLNVSGLTGSNDVGGLPPC